MSSEIKPLPEQAFYGPFFDLVVTEGNWKGRIDATLDGVPTTGRAFETWCRVMHEAIEFYAGGKSSIEVLENGKVRVTAPGYYALIGA